jgi:hypothetical protein
MHPFLPRLPMSKTLALMLTATIAVATAAVATTTTMQIQPAYSQTSHCVVNDPPPPPPSRTCVTQGQNPTTQTCIGGQFNNCDPVESITHQDAAQAIKQQRQACAEGTDTADACTVIHP